jgi:hypothetical protein
LEIAVAAEREERQMRRATWMGILLESAGLARMALRHTPTDEELKPILPMIPACSCQYGIELCAPSP